RDRIRANLLGDWIEFYVSYLHARGHPSGVIQQYAQAVEHLGAWLRSEHIAIEAVTRATIDSFLHDHLPHCQCPAPAVASSTARQISSHVSTRCPFNASDLSTFHRCRSALHRLALFADGPALLDLADVLGGVGHLARRVAHVHVDDADLLSGLDRMVRQRLH